LEPHNNVVLFESHWKITNLNICETWLEYKNTFI